MENMVDINRWLLMVLFFAVGFSSLWVVSDNIIFKDLKDWTFEYVGEFRYCLSKPGRYIMVAFSFLMVYCFVAFVQLLIGRFL